MKSKILCKLAYIIPRSIVYWWALRLIVHATTGKWSNQIVPELTVMEALQRWELGHSYVPPQDYTIPPTLDEILGLKEVIK